MQHTKKPFLPPDLDGLRTSYSKTTGKRGEKPHIFNGCSQVANPLGNSGEPSSLTYLIKTEPNYPVFIVIAEEEGRKKEKQVKLQKLQEGFICCFQKQSLWLHCHQKAEAFSKDNQTAHGTHRHPPLSKSREHSSLILIAQSISSSLYAGKRDYEEPVLKTLAPLILHSRLPLK